MVLQKLEINNINLITKYFALFESLNGQSIDSPLQPEENVLNLMSKWTETNAKFVFMIRLFVPIVSGYITKDIVASNLEVENNNLSMETYFQHADIIDSQLLYLQFIQVVYNIITGQYPTTPALALELGAYYFIYKFKPTNQTTYSIGFLTDRIVEFIPFSHLKGSNLSDWEQRLLTKVQEIIEGNDLNQFNPQRKYLETIILQLPNCYGSTFFRCSQVGLID